jgi:hypothetical protein
MDARGAWRGTLSVNPALAATADYIGAYQAGRAHFGLADVTPNEHLFAHLPTLEMAGYGEILGAFRVVHGVGRIGASAGRHRGQICTVCNPPAVHLKAGPCCSDQGGHI